MHGTFYLYSNLYWRKSKVSMDPKILPLLPCQLYKSKKQALFINVLSKCLWNERMKSMMWEIFHLRLRLINEL